MLTLVKSILAVMILQLKTVEKKQNQKTPAVYFIFYLFLSDEERNEMNVFWLWRREGVKYIEGVISR